MLSSDEDDDEEEDEEKAKEEMAGFIAVSTSRLYSLLCHLFNLELCYIIRTY